jgi:hypothetical protein
LLKQAVSMFLLMTRFEPCPAVTVLVGYVIVPCYRVGFWDGLLGRALMGYLWPLGLSNSFRVRVFCPVKILSCPVPFYRGNHFFAGPGPTLVYC